ncbi:MAG TPA: alpha/beta hydrolase [Caulobacterales bacterium]|nr:alpha/beta hydrolase [Caulobacterales bacterium]
MTIWRVFGGVGAVLVAGLLALIAFQRLLIYHPSVAVVAPAAESGIAVEHLRTPDGQTLIAWYRAPPRQSGAGRGPIFLFFDGNAGRPERWDKRWRDIEQGGAGFLAVNYRGYSGSTGHPTEDGLHEDARTAYDWLVAHGYAAKDIVIDGFSLGTGVAVRLASERPARALVLEAPFTGVDDVAALSYGPLSLLVNDRFASRDYIKRVQAPVLIVHGDRDSTVPFAQGERLYALANEPKEFVRMSGSEHITLVGDGLYAHVFAFLARHPPPP